MFVCRKCEKKYDKPHAASCHYSKCKGINPQDLPFKCDTCGSAFTTAVGLSQNIRHRHPAIRLQQRATAGNSRRVAVDQRRKWTEEETQVLFILLIYSAINMLFDMEARGELEGNYTRAAMELIPGKNEKQIRDKVALLRRSGFLLPTSGHILEVVVEEGEESEGAEGSSDGSPPGSPVEPRE